jgi:hypothetical protein
MARVPISRKWSRDRGAGNGALARQLRTLRVEEVVTAPGTAVLLGLTGLGTLGASIAERTGLLAPGAWLWIGGLGLFVTFGKAVLDFLDRSYDVALWRQLLTEHFAPKGETDLAIDLRCRLAEAEARADEAGRTLVSKTLPAFDTWIDGIARLSGRLGELRYEGRFQVELADTSRRRLSQIKAQELTARDPHLLRQLCETANGLRHQIDAADRFRSFAEGGFLQLEHAIAALGTVGSQLMLVMSRGEDIGGPEALGVQIGQEVASLEGLLHALDRVTDSVSAGSQQPDLSPSLPVPGLPAVPLPDAALSDASSTNAARAGSDLDPRRADRWLQ